LFSKQYLVKHWAEVKLILPLFGKLLQICTRPRQSGGFHPDLASAVVEPNERQILGPLLCWDWNLE
jgi:hypothetical protein